MADTDLGTGLSCTTGLGTRWRYTSGQEHLAECLFRRMTTPRGVLERIGDDADWGYDVRAKLSAGQTQAQRDLIAEELRAELARDERVLDITVTITQDPFDVNSIWLQIEVDSAEGYFPFVVGLAGGAATLYLTGTGG